MEKRSYERRQFNNELNIEISIFEPEGVKNIRCSSWGIDISSKGIGILAPCIVDKGDVIKVFLPFSIVKSEMPVFAEVMWSKIEGESCRAGLRFLN
jgi:hypothetical protein